MRRFNKSASFQSKHLARKIRMTAVAINEDNNDDSLFSDLKKGAYRICYASPECLLRSAAFKKLFRNEAFRKTVVMVAVDEAHVIEDWAVNFRKDYAELEALRVIIGSEIPWLALTATCPTSTFETIYRSLRMGLHRQFYGIDRGSNRPNLALWVRPMQHPTSSHLDLAAFIPESPTSTNDFPKTIFYFKSRRQIRAACKFSRSLVPTRFRHLLKTFTATGSEPYKKKVLEDLLTGDVRFVYASTALGFGTDIPDIVRVVVVGADSLTNAMQMGGRAGRSLGIQAQMIWLIETWAFDPPSGSTEPTTKKAEKEQQMREKLDPAAREFINRSQSDQCMREYALEYFTPYPRLPGFPWYEPVDEMDDDIGRGMVLWDPHNQRVKPGGHCGCNARCCRPNPATPVGLLTAADLRRIEHHNAKIKASKAPTTVTPPTSITSTSTSPEQAGLTPATSTSTVSSSHPDLTPTDSSTNTMASNATDETAITAYTCSRPEREQFKDALHNFRDTFWGTAKKDNPFLSRHWILSDENIKRLVTKAHVLLNMPTTIDVPTLKVLIPKSFDMGLEELAKVAEDFRRNGREHREREAAARPNKRPHTTAPADIGPFTDTTNSLPYSAMLGGWKIDNYAMLL